MPNALHPNRPPIQVHELTKHYPNFSLTDISFTINEGEIVGLVGQNGSGKTTTIKLILGLINANAGSAEIYGVPSRELPLTSGAPLKEHIGVVFDSVAFPNVKLSQIAKLCSQAYSSWDQGLFNKLFTHFDLPKDRNVNELSRGMGMKLSLSVALAHHPRLLILDEATAGLDPLARDEVLEMLRDFISQPGRAILLSSHITQDLEQVADRVICINQGKLVFDLPKDAITDSMGIARCRTSELDEILHSEIFVDQNLPIIRHEFSVDVLIPDRQLFMEYFPSVPCDRMSLNDYILLTMKGSEY